MLHNFYQEIITTVQRMRNDHLADMEDEKMKKLNGAALWKNHLKQDSEELAEAWDDISDNVQQIVQVVDPENYSACMQDYRRRCSAFAQNL